MAYEQAQITIKVLSSSDQCSDEYKILSAMLWQQLSGAAKDTLRGLVLHGPLYDGDVPSKSGRDELIQLGLASKACVKGEQGYQVANYVGWNVFRNANLNDK